MPNEQSRGPRWGWIAAIFGLVIVLELFGEDRDSGGAQNSPSASLNNAPVSDSYASTSATLSSLSNAGSGDYRTDQTLLPSERENYERDRSSQGFSDSDRDFLEEHGVSEDEARAIETITREQGVR